MQSVRSCCIDCAPERAMAVLFLSCCAIAGCASSEHRFPMRDAMWHDTDLDSVWVRCRTEPTPKDTHHVSCAPTTYNSPLYWDGADNLFFRPLSEMLGVVRGAHRRRRRARSNAA